MSNISHANLNGFASATFHVKSGACMRIPTCVAAYLPVTGANKLSRPVAGGAVKAGVLKAH
jgi:alkaline phosphatase D